VQFHKGPWTQLRWRRSEAFLALLVTSADVEGHEGVMRARPDQGDRSGVEQGGGAHSAGGLLGVVGSRLADCSGPTRADWHVHRRLPAQGKDGKSVPPHPGSDHFVCLLCSFDSATGLRTQARPNRRHDRRGRPVSLGRVLCLIADRGGTDRRCARPSDQSAVGVPIRGRKLGIQLGIKLGLPAPT
jgi:hypothetical protein